MLSAVLRRAGARADQLSPLASLTGAGFMAYVAQIALYQCTLGRFEPDGVGNALCCCRAGTI